MFPFLKLLICIIVFGTTLLLYLELEGVVRAYATNHSVNRPTAVTHLGSNISFVWSIDDFVRESLSAGEKES